MATYLFTYRAPQDYVPAANAVDAWSTWYQQLGAGLRDRGNPVFRSDTVGNCSSDSSLGGYSLVRAATLEAAVALARGCPFVSEGGGVEVGEVTNTDSQFDEWLDQHPKA
jgi:hypothetical protein